MTLSSVVRISDPTGKNKKIQEFGEELKKSMSLLSVFPGSFTLVQTDQLIPECIAQRAGPVRIESQIGWKVGLDQVTGHPIHDIEFSADDIDIVAVEEGFRHWEICLTEGVYYPVLPVNCMRLDKKTPCVKTSYCEECKSPDRICNTWTITEKSFPKGRVKVVLINEELGI